LSADENEIALRPAVIGDLEMVFRWRNDPFILSHGSSHREVGWEEHLKWFGETVSNESRRIFIVLEHGNPIGQIRFERINERDCVVSVYLVQEFTGRGYGLRAIRMGCAAIFSTSDVERVVACIRRDNPASRSAFLKAGFRETEALSLCPGDHYSLILSRGTQLE